MALTYKLSQAPRPLQAGHGVTQTLDTDFVVFLADRPLTTNLAVELAIDWPASLEGGMGLRLVVSGEITNVHGIRHTLRIRRYEFRTRGRLSKLAS